MQQKNSLLHTLRRYLVSYTIRIYLRLKFPKVYYYFSGVFYCITLAYLSVIIWLIKLQKNNWYFALPLYIILSLLFVSVGLEKKIQRALYKKKYLKLKKQLRQKEVCQKQKYIKTAASHAHLARLGTLATGLFHDIATPLTTIIFCIEELQQHHQQFKFTANISRLLYHTKQLEQFIGIIKKHLKDPYKKEYFNLTHHSAEVLRLFKYPAIKSNIQIIFKEEQPIYSYHSPIQLTQVLHNLIANACDACEQTQNKRKLIKVSIKEHAGRITLSIKDTGCGIEKTHLAKVGELFFTTKKERGFGIGLAITKTIIEKHFKGTLAIRSKSKIGTTITLCFDKQKAE